LLKAQITFEFSKLKSMSQGQTWLSSSGAGYIGSHYLKPVISLSRRAIWLEDGHEIMFGETKVVVDANKASQ